VAIVHLRASNFYGGPERQIHHHCLQAQKQSLPITVATYAEGGVAPPFIETIAADGVDTELIAVRNAYDRNHFRLIPDLLKKKQTTVFCTHEYRSSVYAALLKRRYDAAWVAFSRGFTRDTLAVRLFQILERFSCFFADHIVCVSESQKKKLQAFGLAGKKISVVHNAVDPQLFKAVTPVNLHLRYNLPAASPLIVSAGRFSQEKGQDILVEAAISLLDENPSAPYYFILFGDGPMLPQIKQRVARSGYSSKILLPGFEKDIIGCLKASTVLVNPSRSEGLPNIVLEAMAVKTMVVATDVGGVGELVTSEQHGLLCPSNNVEALCGAIARALSDGALQKKCIEAAYARVVDSFSFESQCDKLCKVYRTLGAL